MAELEDELGQTVRRLNKIPLPTTKLPPLPRDLNKELPSNVKETIFAPTRAKFEETKSVVEETKKDFQDDKKYSTLQAIAYSITRLTWREAESMGASIADKMKKDGENLTAAIQAWAEEWEKFEMP
jgi:hypothetical protein